MNDHPLGNPNPDDTAVVIAEPSIVDTILNLDELLSADVRRAEKTARFSIKPYLEAEIEELDAELDGLVDHRNDPMSDETSEAAVGDLPADPRAREVALAIRAKQQEYADSMRSVRMRQMPDEDWDVFLAKHKKALDAGAPYPPAMFDELIAACAVAPVIPVVQVREMRKKLGHPPMARIGNVAWIVNTEAGVSIPKSPLSSHVLKRTRRSQS